MDSSIERYLNDHLGGSAGAVDLIHALADHADVPGERDFYLELKAKVEADRALLKSLLEKLDQSASGISEAVGSLTAKAGRVKLMWEGFEPGKLVPFRPSKFSLSGSMASGCYGSSCRMSPRGFPSGRKSTLPALSATPLLSATRSRSAAKPREGMC